MALKSVENQENAKTIWTQIRLNSCRNEKKLKKTALVMQPNRVTRIKAKIMLQTQKTVNEEKIVEELESKRINKKTKNSSKM